MEPAQPADRVPDHTPPDGQPPVPADTVPGDAAPPPALEPGRGSTRSPKDMALSLLVLLVPIALLLGFYNVFLGGNEPTVVDTAPVIAQARKANAFPVVEPSGLGSGWRAVSAKYQPGADGVTVRIGYLSPDGRGVQLVQSNVPPEKLLPTELTRAGQPQGPTELGGQSWQRYTARANEQALVLLTPNRTVIVVGAAREQELREFAGALR